jgi:hypothetical protein
VWPVPMKVTNAKTLKTFKETDKKNKLVSSKNTKEMFDKLVRTEKPLNGLIKLGIRGF